MDFIIILPVLATIISFILGVISFIQLKQEYKKTIKNDITKEQMLSLEEKVLDFYNKHNLTPDGDLEKIVDLLNVKVGEDNEKLEHQAQIELPDKNGYRKVTISRWLSQQEKTFAIAHECAHLINGDEKFNTRPQGYNKPIQEQLADYTAAALLMPLDAVYDYLESINYKDLPSAKRVKAITYLSAKYKVEPAVALRRAKEVYVIKEK